jgi:hypothetical protein
VFPELCTLQTLLLAPKLLDAGEAIDALTDYTPRFEALVTVFSVVTGSMSSAPRA